MGSHINLKQLVNLSSWAFCINVYNVKVTKHEIISIIELFTFSRREFGTLHEYSFWAENICYNMSYSVNCLKNGFPLPSRLQRTVFCKTEKTIVVSICKHKCTEKTSIPWIFQKIGALPDISIWFTVFFYFSQVKFVILPIFDLWQFISCAHMCCVYSLNLKTFDQVVFEMPW